ncbi:hypothetical protein MANAM107_22310 [Actinomyces capricornis]|uniref:Uncharacterized protein n=1 Tax=Actinomyces capricornis TaxID=2755559 RepID=A0ABN6K9U9_9ACTO|nr:hypothetical protein MANAM107_22310 [Actinomyces capricornis]
MEADFGMGAFSGLGPAKQTTDTPDRAGAGDGPAAGSGASSGTMLA